MNSLEYVTSRLGNVQPATRQIATELYEVARANAHEIWFMWGMGTSVEHRTGRALDLMVRNKAAGDFLRDYQWANRQRLRLHHVIWWQRITSTTHRPGVVVLMADRGNPTVNHYDHNHSLFFAGPYRAPTRLQVRLLQYLHQVGSDGKWGPKTDDAVMFMRSVAFAHRGYPDLSKQSFNTTQVKRAQTIVRTKDDGIWGPKSQAALIAWVKEVQRNLGVRTDGWWGPSTDSKFKFVRNRYLNKY
jgi:hypothetical protein